MAGDWIKMRGNLWDDPRIARLVDLTDSSEAQVIGGLYWLWATADQHTADGIMPGLSCRQIDRKTGVQGLGQALVEIGWLADHPEGVRIVNFEDHNGASAKKRAQTAKRVANHRSGNAGETQDSNSSNAPSVTGALAREREEKEEKTENKAPAARVSALTASDLEGFGVDPDTANEFLALRKRHKAPLTPKAWAGIQRECAKAGWTEQAAVQKCVERGWRSFEAEWVQPRASPGVHLNKQEALEARNAAILQEMFEGGI